uniref:Uncharacterized protein n=1 Tax=Anopheles maculatus TaxID=74869 RepID=A0A182SH67_9DIPT
MMPLGDLSAGGGAGDDRSALFAQINQGADITKGKRNNFLLNFYRIK